MPRSALTGSRIRTKRLELGLKQAKLAQEAGISPAYLNLIEHNKRRIGGKLLLDLARILQVDASLLSDGIEDAQRAGLLAAATQEKAGELAQIEEFASRFPGWAGVLTAQQARVQELSHRVSALTDRLSYDPQLSNSLHDVLSAITSIRSTASILAGPDAIGAEWQARFQSNLLDDAKRLAQGAGVLAGYLDGEVDEPAPGTAQEELESYLAKRHYHLPEIEPGNEGRNAPEMPLLANYRQSYAADAARLPLADFGKAIGAGLDPAQLADKFAVDMATVLRRIATLPDKLLPEPVGLVVCDASGTLVFRKPVDGFPLPRFGSGCPQWPLYQALSQPQVPLRILVEQTGRDAPHFMTYAIAQPRNPHSYDAPPMLEATMLIVPQRRAIEGGQLRRVCSKGGCGAEH